MSYTDKEYDEFVEKMETTYPCLFTRPYGGFAIGKGWWPLVSTLCGVIDSHISNIKKSRERNINYNQMLEDCKHGDYRLFNEEYKTATDDYKHRRMEEVIHEEPRKIPADVEYVKVAQIKEKFGGLRFYVDGGDEFVRGAIWLAESLSMKICEECGATGERRSGGWIRTLCDTHEAERQARIEEQARKDGLEL